MKSSRLWNKASMLLFVGAVACERPMPEVPSGPGQPQRAMPATGTDPDAPNGLSEPGPQLPPTSAPGPRPDAREGDCTLTQGFWKNHASAWPVNELRLGQTVYTKPQLLQIFRQSVNGNGLVALAHQLIAARLNLAHGAAPDGMTVQLDAADALIGSLVVPPIGTGHLPTSATTALNDALAQFNEGKVGPGHCDDGNKPTPTPTPTPAPTPMPPPPSPGSGQQVD